MKPRLIGKIVSAIIIAILFALYMRHDHVKGGQMGREAFLAKEGVRFDRHFANPDPVAVDVVASFIMFGCVFGGYELLAFIGSTLVKKAGGATDNPTDASGG